MEFCNKTSLFDFRYKKFMTTIAAVCACITSNSFAENFSFPVDFEGSYPVRFEANEPVDVPMTIDTLFDEIEDVCIVGSTKQGTANGFSAFYELDDVPSCTFPIELGQLVMLTYSDGSNIPNERFVRFCDSSMLPDNFLDGESSVRLNASGGYVEFWDFQLEISGTASQTQVALSWFNEGDNTVPFYGGKLKYNAKIANWNPDATSRTLLYWSVIRFPNGDEYSVQKVKEVTLEYMQSQEFTKKKVKIPDWFESGDYELIWYVMDPETQQRKQDSLSFSKE